MTAAQLNNELLAAREMLAEAGGTSAHPGVQAIYRMKIATIRKQLLNLKEPNASNRSSFLARANAAIRPRTRPVRCT